MEAKENHANSKDQFKQIAILMAIGGTVVFSILCIMFLNNVLSSWGAMNTMAISGVQPSHDKFVEISKNVLLVMPVTIAMVISGVLGLLGFALTFIEYGVNKKHSKILSLIPIAGGIVCLIGLNLPTSTVASILFAVGGAVLTTGVAGKMGLFNVAPKQE